MKRYTPKMFTENPVTKEKNLFEDYTAKRPFLEVEDHIKITMVEHSNGEWVRLEDVERILQEIEIKSRGPAGETNDKERFENKECFVDKNGVVLSKGMLVKYKWWNLNGTGIVKYLRYGYPKELGFSNLLPLAMVDFNEKQNLNGAEMGTGCLEIV